MKCTKALLIVDVQNDFLPGGALAVPHGDAIIPNINHHIARFHQEKCPIFASRDWHPAETKHFKAYGGAWPAHCVQDTPGARFHFELKLPRDCVIISKGMDPGKDSYSAFDAIDAAGTPFEQLLRDRGITILYIVGLATDYCVKATALDAERRGFKTIVFLDAIKGVDVRPGDSTHSIDVMAKAGIRFTEDSP